MYQSNTTEVTIVDSKLDVAPTVIHFLLLLLLLGTG